MSSASLDTVASRYAIALFGIAQGKKKEQKFLDNVNDFATLLKSSRDLMLVLTHPNVKRADKQAILTWIIGKSQYDSLFQNFIRLLTDRSKISLVPRIAIRYSAILDESQGRERATVVSAQALTPSQRAALKSRLSEQRDCDVVLNERVDENVLGGIRVEIGGRVFDATIKRHLERLREQLARS
ncbi:MAG: ATP synthase F1 subunit delta [Bradymonadia bacterium]|jgi:F-type H+-transporting ATPase subunit delta